MIVNRGYLYMQAGDARDLKPHDITEGPKQSELASSHKLEAAPEKIRQLRRPLRADLTFDRIEANER